MSEVAKDRVLFVWIPRTGGTSLCAALEAGGIPFQRINEKRPDAFDRDCRVTTFQHSSIGRLLAAGVIDHEWLRGCWTFAVVRNPWDRLVSLYSRLQHGTESQREAIGRLGGSFAAYARYVADGRAPALDGCLYPPVESLASRQSDWLDWPAGEPDYIGRFEELPDAWGPVRAAMPELPPIGRANAAPHGDYREYYTPQLRDAVGDYYAGEIERFGYRF